MLRWVLFVLISCNGLFWIWTSGSGEGMGLSPEDKARSARIMQPVYPDRLHLKTAQNQSPIAPRLDSKHQLQVDSSEQGAVDVTASTGVLNSVKSGNSSSLSQQSAGTSRVITEPVPVTLPPSE